MNLTESICRRAARADAVAFDVFDTLIKRDTATPTELFRMRGEAFYTARIEAEREARAAKGGEVTLAEIYARPCLAGYDPAQECAAELAACVPYRPVLDAVQQLRRQGKKLYYISDMYLPQTQIDAMLRRCGRQAKAHQKRQTIRGQDCRNRHRACRQHRAPANLNPYSKKGSAPHQPTKATARRTTLMASLLYHGLPRKVKEYIP